MLKEIGMHSIPWLQTVDAYERGEGNTEEEMELTVELCSERTDPLQFLLAQPATVKQ